MMPYDFWAYMEHTYIISFVYSCGMLGLYLTKALYCSTIIIRFASRRIFSKQKLDIRISEVFIIDSHTLSYPTKRFIIHLTSES